MTPELKIACEVVFQEHKKSLKPVNWSRDVFSGRLPFGLSAKAKEILVSKNIISFPNPEKKIITRLNPVAVAATNFEEADALIQNKVPSFATNIVVNEPAVIINDEPAYAADDINDTPKKNNYRLIRIKGNAETVTVDTTWYTKPLYVYVVWPLSAAVAGALITWLMSSVFTKVFF